MSDGIRETKGNLYRAWSNTLQDTLLWINNKRPGAMMTLSHLSRCEMDSFLTAYPDVGNKICPGI